MVPGGHVRAGIRQSTVPGRALGRLRRVREDDAMTCSNCGQENPPGFLFCGRCGQPLVPPAGGPGEERKVVTVLFADVTGSTALGERLDPERLKDVMGAYFD